MPAEGPLSSYRIIGRPLPRFDVVDKVRGNTLYAADWTLPGMLEGRVLRAPFAPAKIRAIDTSRARRLPGVVAVLTAWDVPNNFQEEDPTGLGLVRFATPVLAQDRVLYQGEPVAVVAAETPERADEALECIDVEYEPMVGVFDVEEALNPDAPRVHPDFPTGNLLVRWATRQGDPEAAFAEAAVVVERTYRTQWVDHAYLEPEAGVAWVDSNGVLVIRSSTQVVEHFREIARILGLPQNLVRVVAPFLGGGFGGKEDMTVEPYVALLAWKTGRPVRMVWRRQESLLARPKRHPFIMRYRTAASRDGLLLAHQIRLLADAGPYPLLSPRVVFAAFVTAAGPYRVPALDLEAVAVFTNNVPTSAMRGFGAMQVVFAYESQMDLLAEALGMDRLEIRRRNVLHKGDRLATTGEEVETVVALPEATERVLAALGEPSKPSKPWCRVGRGFAWNMQPYGRARWFQDQGSAWVGFEEDGTLVVRAGVPDVGGGQAAALARIAAEVLGISPERVVVHFGDSALTPLTGGTFATRQLYISGNAVLKASRELKEQISPVAADLLEAREEDLDFADNGVSVVGAPDRRVGFDRVVAECRRRGVPTWRLSTFEAEAAPFDPTTGRGKTFPDFTYGCHGIEVEVDTETGQVRVLKAVACHDVGRAINPQSVEGQIQGGAAMGLGQALMEEVVLQGGQNLTTLFAHYEMPTAADLPDISPIVLESGEGKGPFNARGVGEPPIGPPLGAIPSAVYDAVGVRIYELPLTPERVLRAIQAASQEQL